MEQYSEHIFPMMARAGEIFSAAVASFTTRDMEEAKEIIGRDDEIDGLFNSVKNDLITSLRKNADSPDLSP
jgi:phosphate transport system protein